MHITACN